MKIEEQMISIRDDSSPNGFLEVEVKDSDLRHYIDVKYTLDDVVNLAQELLADDDYLDDTDRKAYKDNLDWSYEVLLENYDYENHSEDNLPEDIEELYSYLDNCINKYYEDEIVTSLEDSENTYNELAAEEKDFEDSHMWDGRF